MTRRERLTAMLRGEPVDRPPVSFYEIGGWRPNPDDPDPFNVYNGPTWRPLLALAEERTDLIRMAGPRVTPPADDPRAEFFTAETWLKGGSRFARTTLRVAGRTLQSVSRRGARKRAMELLESVGLADKAGSHPNMLSAGQCQRIALARALASNPDLILADEPTASLDA